jgi:hypothetical protein
MRMKNRNRDLDNTKEDCKEFICSKAQEIVNDASITDEWDLDCLSDDLNHLLDICEKIERCRGVKSVKRVMYKYYSVQETNKVIN